MIYIDKSMEQLYDQALINMENTVHALAQRVPAPQRVPYKDSFVYRYAEKSIHQALVQKLARLVSTLHAARLLMEHGFVQEQATLQRVLDEITEDITFLAFGVIFSDMTPLHQNYLDAFFEEEFDADTALESTQKRPMIARKKIRAYISRLEGVPVDPSRLVEASRTLSKAYSGYVHAASPQIMDMYGGNPPKFHMRGMRETPRRPLELLLPRHYRVLVCCQGIRRRSAFHEDLRLQARIRPPAGKELWAKQVAENLTHCSNR